MPSCAWWCNSMPQTDTGAQDSLLIRGLLLVPGVVVNPAAASVLNCVRAAVGVRCTGLMGGEELSIALVPMCRLLERAVPSRCAWCCCVGGSPLMFVLCFLRPPPWPARGTPDGCMEPPQLY
jgi:hypothetical protein